MDTAPSFHPLDYVSVLRRRRWWLVAPLVVAVVAGVLLATFLPRRYSATAVLGVSLPSVSGPLLSDAQRVSADERQRNIQQVLLSQPVLERVVKAEKLEAGASMGDAVRRIRSNVKVTIPPPQPNAPQGSTEQFLVSYGDATAADSQRVINRLADTFVEESSRRREVRAEETSSFISMQQSASQTRLAGLEERLRKAKESYMGALPEQTSANVAMVTGLQQQLETTANALRGEQDRLSIVERQIESMRGVAADAAGAAPPAAASALRAAQLENELAAARSIYTEKHPEVVRLREDLAAARKAAAADASRPEADRLALLQNDPGYRALVRDQEQSRLRIRELQRQEAQIGGQIAMYRQRVESAPRVEQQIATLQREYDLERQQYGDLTAKLRNAEIAEQLERSQGGERFTVLSHASLPDAPESPNVPRVLLLAVMVGVCLGGGLALGREYLDRSIYDARSLNDFDLPVLGEIPRIANA